MEFKNILGDTQMYNVSNPDVNEILKYLRQYTNLNVNSKSKKGTCICQMIDRITTIPLF
jgi:hypothetical protein